MKSRIYLSLATALVAGIAMFFAGRGCADPSVIERVRIDTLRLAGDTIVVPGRPVVVRIRETITDSAAYAAASDSLEALRAQLARMADDLAEYGWLTASVDTQLVRSARIVAGSREWTVDVSDRISAEYDYLPLNRWRIAAEPVTVTFPDTLAIGAPEPRPWYIDAALVTGGAIVTGLIGLLK